MNPTYFAAPLLKLPPTPSPTHQHKYAVKTILIHRVEDFENEKVAVKNSIGAANVHYNCWRQAEMPRHLTHIEPYALCENSLDMYPGVDVQAQEVYIHVYIYRPNLLLPPETSAEFLRQFKFPSTVHEGSHRPTSLQTLGSILILPVKYTQSDVSLSISSHSC